MNTLTKPVKGTKGEPAEVVTFTPNLQKAPSTGTVQLPLTVPPHIKREFKAYSAEKDLSMSALFQIMWDEYRKSHP